MDRHAKHDMITSTQASLSFAGQTWGRPLGRRLGEASGLWRAPFVGSHRAWGGLGVRGSSQALGRWVSNIRRSVKVIPQPQIASLSMLIPLQ